MAEQNYLYRYRSLDSLYTFKELENLEIYFAKPDELNDQMEDYMNIFWQGDEIAFRGLFKHYLYVLSSVYYDASIRNRKQKIDPNLLPVFLAVDINEKPEMETTFKSIYYEFFAPEGISNLPIKMSESNKKYTADEILLILKTIHSFAYFVVDSMFKKFDRGIDVFKDKEHKEIYDSVKYNNEYSKLIKILNSPKTTKQEIIDLINKKDLERIAIQKFLNNKHKDRDTNNINILSFEFPEIYLKRIKRLLYENHYIACFTTNYTNEPMWGHYANSENGICLRFKTNKNQIEMCPISEKYGYQNLDFYKVIYSTNYPEIDFFSSLGCLQYNLIKDFWLCNYDRTRYSICCEKYKNITEWREEYHKKAKKYICTKSKNWIHEDEYRLFLRDSLNINKSEKGIIAKYKIKDLDAIIFGGKVSSENKLKIIKIILKHCQKEKIKVFKFYDLYYSTITNKLELKHCCECIYL